VGEALIMSTKPKRFRLSFVGATEDCPKLIRAYGRAWGGEIALMMHPTLSHAILVHLVGKHAEIWDRSADHLGEPWDSPLVPSTATPREEAIATVKRYRESVPRKGPVTLRGQWTGFLYVHDKQPKVELRRNLATYGTLWITSNLEQGWRWRFERAKRWFTDNAHESGAGQRTLMGAIKQGIEGAASLVRPACSFRDTRRRAAYDSVYAERYPIRPVRSSRDPTERLHGPAKRRRAPPPAPLEDGTPLPESPVNPALVQQMAMSAAQASNHLREGNQADWLWEETVPAVEIAEWFEQNSLPELGSRIREYLGSAGSRPSEVLQHLRRALKARERTSPGQRRLDAARAKLDELEVTLATASAQMERARMLIRYATALVHSPLCKGAARTQALAQLQEARAAYEGTRKAITEGQSIDAQQTLRRIGQQVALAAARAAKSCAANEPSSSTTRKRRKTAKKPRKKASASTSPPAQTTLDEALIRAFAAAIPSVLEEEVQ